MQFVNKLREKTFKDFNNGCGSADSRTVFCRVQTVSRRP